MRNRLLYLCLALLIFSGCHRSEKMMLPHHNFTIDKYCPHTLPLHQGRTSACWAYSMASLAESELLALNSKDTIRISPMYVVRQKYLKQFDAYYYSHGREEIRNGSLGHSFLRVWREDGLMPLEVYPGYPSEARRHNHRRLLKQLRKLAEEAVERQDLPTSRQRAIALLDKEMGSVPDSFVYRGHTYTPRSFADSLPIRPEQFAQLTSFTHQPPYTYYILEAADNWEHQPYLNLPLDSLEQSVQCALASGHTVAWHGDISEPTYNARQGMAVWDSKVTPSLRQQYFEDFATTDDHMMHIVGTAHDETGHLYYLLKDSYGLYPPYEGFIYMSQDYFRAKTLSVTFRIN